MALRALRRRAGAVPGRYKGWVRMIQEKAKTPEDSASVSALSAVCDYYGRDIQQDELSAKNNFEVNWEDWSHIVTPGLVDKLKEKVNAISQEHYETEGLASEAMHETDSLKTWRHIVTWNAAVNLHYIAEQDSLIENLSNARPLQSLDLWEVQSMWKYDDCPTRWDQELGWYMPNNDQVSEDPVSANYFQFQKDYGKVALMRYYYDWMGKHQILCTVGKLSQTERED